MGIADQNGTTPSVSTEMKSGKDLPPSMIERLTLILDAFGGRGARITLEQVACRTRLPRSTVHRILDQLTTFGWVEHASFGYCLGRRALRGTATARGAARFVKRPHRFCTNCTSRPVWSCI